MFINFKGNGLDIDRRRFGPFPNGYDASVISGQNTLGGDQGLWEFAVLKDGVPYYDTEITSDVIGYLTWDEAMKLVERVKNLPAAE